MNYDNRYQYQPWYIKFWRMRYYLLIPFLVLKAKFKQPKLRMKEVWSIYIGLAQIKMDYFYYLDEIE